MQTREEIIIFSSVYDDAGNDPTAFFVHQLKKSTLFFLPIQSPFGSAKTEFRDGHVHVSDFRAHHIYRDFFVLLNFFPLFGFRSLCRLRSEGLARPKPRRQLPISDGSCWLRPESTSCSTSAFGLKLGIFLPMHPLWFIGGAIWCAEVVLPRPPELGSGSAKHIVAACLTLLAGFRSR